MLVPSWQPASLNLLYIILAICTASGGGALGLASRSKHHHTVSYDEATPLDPFAHDAGQKLCEVRYCGPPRLFKGGILVSAYLLYLEPLRHYVLSLKVISCESAPSSPAFFHQHDR